MAQSVKSLTLDAGSGHNLRVHGIKPCVGLCADSAKPAWDSLSLSLSAPCLLTHTHSLKINKHLQIKQNKNSKIEIWPADLPYGF